MLKNGTKQLVRAGLIGALYVVLSLITFNFSSGPIHLRLSEGITLLPLIFPESVVGVFVGCLISNIISGCFLLDVVFGSLITLIAGLLTFLIGKCIKNGVLNIFVGGLFPVLLNAFLLPLIWYFCYGELEYMYILQVVFLLISQSLSVYMVGSLLITGIRKLQIKGVQFFK